MAAPSFENFYQAARRHAPGISLDVVRAKYQERYNRPGIFTKPVAKYDFVSAAEKRGIDPELAAEEYERRYNTMPWYKDVGYAAGRTLGGFGSTLGGVSDFLTGGLAGEGLSDASQRLQARFAPETNLAQPFLQGDSWKPNWDLMARPSWWASGLTEVAGSMGPSLGAGVAAKALKYGPKAAAAIGSAVGGAQEGFGGTYQRAREEGQGRGEAGLRALGMMGGTSALNYPGIARILNRANTSLGARGITGLIEGTTELAEEPLEATIMGEDPIEATRQGMAVLPLAAVTGGLMPGAATSVKQQRRQELEDDLRDVREAVPGRPATEPLNIITSSGTNVEAVPRVVPVDDVITSDNPQFPAQLQPRNRDRDASRIQVQEIANKLDGTRLLPNREADRGAPVVEKIVDEQGNEKWLVVSGNARTMAIRKAQSENPERAGAYKQVMNDHGFEVGNNQMVVSEIVGQVDPVQFALEANQADTLNLGASEQAQADARVVDAELLSRYQGGDLDLARNADFVRDFIGRVPTAQRNDLIDDDGRISQVGIRRIQGALLAYAYGEDGNLPGLSRMLESTDDNTRAITGGLIDAAPYLAELKTRIGAGQVAPQYDIGPVLAMAAQRVSEARRNRQNIEELLLQQDAFSQQSPLEKSAIGFFAGIRNRKTLASRLQSYADTAMREGDTRQTGMFAGDSLTPEQILGVDELDLAAAMPRDPENAIKLGMFTGAIDTGASERPPRVRRPTTKKETTHRNNVENNWVRPLIAGWGANAPRVHVMATTRDLPLDVRWGLQSQFGLRAANQVEGVRMGNDIYLNAKAMRRPKQVAKLLAHEAVGHHGMETMLGEERFVAVMNQTLALTRTDPVIKKIADELSDNYTNPETGEVDREVLAKEVIAHLAETNPNHTLIQRLLAYVREFLRRMGFDKRFPNVKFTRKDLEALLIRANKHLAKSNMAVFQGGEIIPVPEGMALEMARVAHEGQQDYAGKDYFPHVQRVGRQGRDMYERITGYLHDIVEDTNTTLGDLRGVYPKKIVDAVKALTWREDLGETYDDYMKRVLANPLAAAVKFYDARDNMRLKETGPDSAMMRQRTYEAMKKAWKAMQGPKPPLQTLEEVEAEQQGVPQASLDGDLRNLRQNEGEWLPDVFIKKAGGAAVVDKILAGPPRIAFDKGQGGLSTWAESVTQHAKTPETWEAIWAIANHLTQGKGVANGWQRRATFRDRGLSYLRTYAQNQMRMAERQPQASMPVDRGLQRVHQNLGKLSRTYAGVQDNAGSAQKAELFLLEGDEAANQARANVEKAWQYAMQNQAIASPRKLLGVMNEIANIVTGGLIPQNKILREHDVQEKGGALRYLPAGQVRQGLVGFADDLYSMMDTAQPVELAAFIHRRFNHELHPYSDGVSKITEVLTDWALARRGEEALIPQMPERGEFFRNVTRTKGDLGAWTEYMRTLMPTRLQAMTEERHDADEFNAWLDILDPALAQDYRDLIADKNHKQDLAIEFATLSPGGGARRQLDFARRILNESPEQTRERYAGLDDTMDGLKLDVDEFRELYGPYQNNRSGLTRATHEVASAWIKNRWRELLNLPAPAGKQNLALVTGGGSGAGKTTAMNENGMGSAKVILDAVNGKASSTDKKIRQAIAAGNRVEYLLVDRDVAESWVNGVMIRAMINGRTVPLDVHLSNHVGDGGGNHLGARETARNIILKFGHLPEFQYRVWSTENNGWTSFTGLPPFEARDKLYNKGLLALAGIIENGGAYDRKGKWREIYPQQVKGLLPTDYARNEQVPQAVRELLEVSARTRFGLTGAAEAGLENPAGGRGLPQAALAAEELPPSQGRLFEPGNELPRTRLESGGGSYSSRQFATVTDQEYTALKSVFDITDRQTAEQRGGRGPKSWKDTETEALEMIVKNPEAVRAGLINRKLGDSANAVQLEAYAMTFLQAVDDAVASAVRAAQTNSDEDLAIFASHFEKMAALQAPYAGYMTEAGRSLNIIAKAKRAAVQAEQILENLPDGMTEKLRGSVVSSKRDRWENLARDIATSSPAETASKARKLHKPGAFDKVYEYWVNSILSGPDTHMVNNASNALFQLVENLSQTVGAALPGGTPMRSAMARWVGSTHGIKMGAKMFRRAFQTGLPQMGIEQQKFIEAPHLRAIEGRKGELIRLPGRALLAEDEFWKSIAYYGHASELAMRQAMAEGGDVRQRFAEIMGNLEEHPEIIEEAQREAHRLTFTTKMVPALAALNRALIKTRVGKFIAPFIRTPSNILKEAIRYTPGAGLMIEQTRQDIMGKNGAEARAAAYGRWIVGSSMYLMTGIMAAAGDISGAGPDDDNERRLLMRTGWQPYSIRMDGKWYKYNRLEPVGMILGLAADSIEIGKFAQGGELDKVYALVMGSLMNNLADKTFLSGVFDFTEAITDPQRYGARWVSRMTSSFIPNVMAQPTWKADPLVREARTQVERIRSRLPTKRQQLRPILDIAGEPIKQTSSPIPGDFRRISEEQSDPLAETMLRLGLFRGKPGRTVQRVKLADDEYSDYASFLQQTRWRLLTPYIQSPQFQELAAKHPEEARALLDKLWTKIGNEARMRWLYQNPDVLVRAYQEKSRPRAIGSDYLQ
jgi:hypothetical protein